jgi:hypothetical protein
VLPVNYGRHEFGRCPCTGYYEHREVEVQASVAERIVVLTHVPQGACSRCDSRVYKMETLQRIESLITSRPEKRAG